jgi:hypothetical protein
LLARVVQAVCCREHALRCGRTRGRPLLALSLDDGRACLVRAIGSVVHAAICRLAWRAEVEARTGAARETREVRPGACVIRTRGCQTADIGCRRGRARAGAACACRGSRDRPLTGTGARRFRRARMSRSRRRRRLAAARRNTGDHDNDTQATQHA